MTRTRSVLTAAAAVLVAAGIIYTQRPQPSAPAAAPVSITDQTPVPESQPQSGSRRQPVAENAKRTVATKAPTVPNAPSPIARADAGVSPLGGPVSEEQIRRVIERSGARVADLSVHLVEGIVVLKGKGAPADIRTISDALATFGVKRVANLITPGATVDDDAIRRYAERQLTASRSLDGCRLQVTCERSVLRVSGTVQNELQKDAAREILRKVPGATAVHIDLKTM